VGDTEQNLNYMHVNFFTAQSKYIMINIRYVWSI